MNEKQLLEHIVINPKVMVGKPVVKGTRLTVEYILGLLAHGVTFDEIMGGNQDITTEDILTCLLFATKSLESTTFMPLTMEPF